MSGTPLFVLLPGAGGSPWYWHRVVPLLAAAGAEAVAVDLPASAPGDSLAGCVAAVLAVLGARGDGRDDVVLVAQSMGAFTAPDVAALVPVRAIILVNPMTPAPGETPGEWWAATDQPAAQRAADVAAGRDPDAPFDVWTRFLHDVPPEVAAAGADQERAPADSLFSTPPAMTAWPRVPTVQLSGRDDRLFPLAFQQTVARARLGIEPEVLPGGHLLALSQPERVAARLLALAAAAAAPR
jgi:alpha-beta hydrolase superfamily lysophospholipase